MKFLNYTFFYTYIGLVLLAGFWGAFLYPSLDFTYLFKMEINDLPDFSKVNMLSQYRFLRALELGYGLFAIVFIKEIFHLKNITIYFLPLWVWVCSQEQCPGLSTVYPAHYLSFFWLMKLWDGLSFLFIAVK